ncbi:hypothetical protein BJ170DRAFT_684949 [Xylariales sp. AK1849]|nr:hypothetical protein BJ170DRAFT_684949 [Xylariales sp. AK1849]
MDFQIYAIAVSSTTRVPHPQGSYSNVQLASDASRFATMAAALNSHFSQRDIRHLVDSISLFRRKTSGSGGLVAVICVLVILLLGTAMGYVLLRRFFQKRKKAPVTPFVGDQAT